MNGSTNTTVTVFGGAVAFLFISALHYFFPDFMNSVGTGGDVAFTTLVTGILGHFLPADFLQPKG